MSLKTTDDINFDVIVAERLHEKIKSCSQKMLSYNTLQVLPTLGKRNEQLTIVSLLVTVSRLNTFDKIIVIAVIYCLGFQSFLKSMRIKHFREENKGTITIKFLRE